MAKILVALTDRDDAIKIGNYLEDRGETPYIVTDSSSLLEKVSRGDFSVLILDTDIIPELELNIVKFIKERNTALKVVLVTSREKMDTAIDLARKDSFVYMAKPVNLHELGFFLDKLLRGPGREEARDLPDDYFASRFVGRSEKIRKVMLLAQKVAKSESSILITGETGTGKELISRAIHELSSRANAPFIAVNCAAIPDNLLESELFGYKKGAFTGASADKKGLIELADTGTLFLDEIGDLSLHLQSKLLRVLEYKELRRLGDEAMRKVNIRILAATNQDIPALIREKKFREDLFFRLNVINIHIPPLRERKEDIPFLIRFFIEKYNKQGGRNIVGIDAKARAILMQYDYPGNVREIDNVIQHAFALSSGDIIGVDDLPVHMHNISPYFSLEAHAEGSGQAMKLKPGADPDLILTEVEKRTILKAFARYPQNHTKTARALGISRSTLWRKMKEYGIQADPGTQQKEMPAETKKEKQQPLKK
ncbi:MAG: sigma-54 dependent transcriptional regulator [Spirochaetia bacterium]|nr:sigma-54 dependent transcriptional regulator [Spirochaetia bacterium]